MERFLLPLALTLALELLVALLWGLRRRDLLLCVLANVLTNPAVNLAYLLVPTAWTVLFAECAAVGAEACCYRFCGEGIRRPLLLSLAANTLSFCVGVFLL
ncbi:MAG: hypothetical protein EOM52_07565 [Clostridia bacterium]|nr:hypothetical protein [Clostridia bacterium]